MNYTIYCYSGGPSLDVSEYIFNLFKWNGKDPRYFLLRKREIILKMLFLIYLKDA